MRPIDKLCHLCVAGVGERNNRKKRKLNEGKRWTESSAMLEDALIDELFTFRERQQMLNQTNKTQMLVGLNNNRRTYHGIFVEDHCISVVNINFAIILKTTNTDKQRLRWPLIDGQIQALILI